jgi:hypothetical protein
MDWALADITGKGRKRVSSDWNVQTVSVREEMVNLSCSV